MTSHARSTDPDTSHAAVPKDITEQCLIVLLAYRSGDALLDNVAYRRAGLGGARAKSQRCSDLRQFGFIERCGKAQTPSGKWGYLCRITMAGLAYLDRVAHQWGLTL